MGRTAAEIDGAIREARSRARHQERELTFGDVVAALRLEEDPELIERIAVHEAGHAVVALKLGRGVIRHIMVGPTSGAVAFAKQNSCVTIQQIEDEITCLLAGRAAEEVVLGCPSAGAGGGPESDLARATELALKIEPSFGLGAETLLYRGISDAVVAADPAVRSRAESRLKYALDRARGIVEEDRTLVERLARDLLEKRIIEGPTLTDRGDMGALNHETQSLKLVHGSASR